MSDKKSATPEEIAGVFFDNIASILRGYYRFVSEGKVFPSDALVILNQIGMCTNKAMDSLGHTLDYDSIEDLTLQKALVKFCSTKMPSFPVTESSIAEVASEFFTNVGSILKTYNKLFTLGEGLSQECLSLLAQVSQALRKVYIASGTSPDVTIPDEKSLGDALNNFLPKGVR
jgi:hypothetical protein